MLVGRDYTGPPDLRSMQDLAQRIWSPARRFHIGDLAWARHSIPGSEATFRTRLWEDDGQVIAWGWAELSGHLDLLVDPRQDAVVVPVIDWFEDVAAGPVATCTVMEGDVHVASELLGRRYSARGQGPFFVRLSRAVTNLPDVALHDGFTITHVEAGQAQRRAEAHRAGWSDLGSRVSTESYAQVMTTYPYRPCLEPVAVAPDGSWVASALGWYDEGNHVGLVEPVSCAPAYRGLGLARALNVALLHAFKEVGGETAVILPRGDDAYPAPKQLYQGIGYVSGPRTVHYQRGGHPVDRGATPA